MSAISDKIIVAFDLNDLHSFQALACELKGKATTIKIGMECFYSLGPATIELAKKNKFKVFLDLKLHDIPNTVANSVYALTKLGVDMINVHALGGLEMMRAARSAVDKASLDFNLPAPPKLIAVTHLTSLDQSNLENELGIKKDLKESAQGLANLAKEAGLDGVVCSAHEAKGIKSACGESFLTVTPGIRTADSIANDQKRIMTPQNAIASGSDYMVIGRSITKSANPSQTFEQILKDIS